MQFMYIYASDVIALANLLDPRYQRDNLSNIQKKAARNLHMIEAGDHQAETIIIYQEYLMNTPQNKQLFLPSIIKDPISW